MADDPTELDLSEIRRHLEAERDALTARVGDLARSPEPGSGLGFGKRIGDGTIEAVSRLTDVGVGAALERQLEHTERALLKLDAGTYGTCDGCGGAIAPGRLRARPESVLCIACASGRPRVPPPRR